MGAGPAAVRKAGRVVLAAAGDGDRRAALAVGGAALRRELTSESAPLGSAMRKLSPPDEIRFTELSAILRTRFFILRNCSNLITPVSKQKTG